MKENKEMEIIERVSTHDTNPRQYIQKFQYHNNLVEHQNRLQIQRVQGSSQQFQIRNHFATIEGGKVIKETEIVLGDKIIKILDELSLPQNKKPEKLLEKEVKMEQQKGREYQTRKNILAKKFKTVTNQEGEEQFKIRDTKNVVKNIFKLFQNWVDQQVSSQHKVQLKQSLTDLLKTNKKFNNNLIRGISRNQHLRKAFIVFSESEGETLIELSRIQDKVSHIQALRKYYYLCSNSDYDMNNKRDVHNNHNQSQCLVKREYQEVQ